MYKEYMMREVESGDVKGQMKINTVGDTQELITDFLTHEVILECDLGTMTVMGGWDMISGELDGFNSKEIAESMRVNVNQHLNCLFEGGSSELEFDNHTENNLFSNLSLTDFYPEVHPKTRGWFNLRVKITNNDFILIGRFMDQLRRSGKTLAA